MDLGVFARKSVGRALILECLNAMMETQLMEMAAPVNAKLNKAGFAKLVIILKMINAFKVKSKLRKLVF